MFTRLWKQLAASPLGTVVLAAALVVIAVQLSAFVVVLQGQMQRAELRESLRTTTNAAMANCIYSRKGADVDACRTSTTVAYNH